MRCPPLSSVCPAANDMALLYQHSLINPLTLRVPLRVPLWVSFIAPMGSFKGSCKGPLRGAPLNLRYARIEGLGCF